MNKYVYVLTTDVNVTGTSEQYDHRIIVGCFDSEEAAERVMDYLMAADKQRKDFCSKSYSIAEMKLNQVMLDARFIPEVEQD